LFFRSMTAPEQRHIVSAFAFELGKVETASIRRRMLGHLDVVDKALGAGVAQALGMEGQADKIQPARRPVDLPSSPALSLVAKAPTTLQGRKVAMLVGDGSDQALIAALLAALKKEGAELAVIAPKMGGARARVAARSRSITRWPPRRRSCSTPWCSRRPQKPPSCWPRKPQPSTG
jgi:catalase